MIKKKQKQWIWILIGIAVVGLLFMKTQPRETCTGLSIELYNANKENIGNVCPVDLDGDRRATIELGGQSYEAVHYIKLTAKTVNTGATDLVGVEYQLKGPNWLVLDSTSAGKGLSYVLYSTSNCTDTSSGIDEPIVQCSPTNLDEECTIVCKDIPNLSEGESYIFSSGLLDVDLIFDKLGKRDFLIWGSALFDANPQNPSGLIKETSSYSINIVSGTEIIIDPQPGIEDVTITFDSFDKFSPDLEITNGRHRLFINNIDYGWFFDEDTLKVEPGDALIVYFGLDSTTHYTVKKVVTVPSSKTMTLSAGLTKGDSTPSWTFWNEDGQVMTENIGQKIGANSLYKLPFRIKSSSRLSLGNPDVGCELAICFKYNSLAFTTFKIANAEGIENPSGLPPTANEHIWDCYGIPTIVNDPNNADDGDHNGELIIETSSEIMDLPTIEKTADVMMWDCSLDLDDDTLTEIIGREDENDNNLGLQNDNEWGMYDTPIYLY